jgi:hypothetical protein
LSNVTILKEEGGPEPHLPITIEHPRDTDQNFYKFLVGKFGMEDLRNDKIWGQSASKLAESRRNEPNEGGGGAERQRTSRLVRSVSTSSGEAERDDYERSAKFEDSSEELSDSDRDESSSSLGSERQFRIRRVEVQVGVKRPVEVAVNARKQKRQRRIT